MALACSSETEGSTPTGSGGASAGAGGSAGSAATGGTAGAPMKLVAVTFNTGTTEGLNHDAPPDDGYSKEDAVISDTHYGDGLAWVSAVEATRQWFAEVQPDLVGFQEIFFSGDCANIPAEFHAGFVCESWQEGDPTVANVILGEGYQVACHPGKNDKCAAVKRSFGSFRGCNSDFCLEGLEGFRVEDCGGGARVGRGTVDLADGGSLTFVNIHGSSGILPDDQGCRVKQFEQAFLDLGDGQPGVSGERNIALGDLNTDPGRNNDFDDSAIRLLDFVGDDKSFQFVSDVGPQATPSYANLFNIDHVMSDSFDGECWIAGVTEGRDPVLEAIYFDHKPVVCELTERR